MIVVKVELHSAISGKVTTLDQAVIANDGKHGAASLGNYDMFVANKRTAQSGDLRRTIEKPARHGRITNFPRKSYSIWRMIARLLLEAFPEEHPHDQPARSVSRSSVPAGEGRRTHLGDGSELHAQR